MKPKQVIYNLIEVENKKTMLARGNDEYAFKIIDPAVVPRDRSRPKRTLIILKELLFGPFAGVMVTSFGKA